MIIEGIKEKKGKNVTVINLDTISNSPCSFFVICSANSNTQINAIANNIEKLLLENMNLKIWKQEGRQSNWRVLDYFDIIIHIFKEETRQKYQLEELWADGIIQKIDQSE